MSATENRIVKMQFDNGQFKKGAADSMKSLADLNKAVDGAGKSKGLLDLDRGMQQVGVTASKMAIITTTALATIANKVTNTALSLANSLTFAPIREGFTEYESLLTKQNVIMNATGKSADAVKAVLRELNDYSDKTIYNFGNMTDSVQKFVNAGVPLDRAVISIKGIANAAAFAGASAEEANRGMYAFAQAMQTGHIMLQDWMQIENANMGTIQFKKELLKAGVAAGTLRKQGKGFITESGKFVSATKGWRDGLQEQWATTEVLNKALGKYADTNTKLGAKAFRSAQDVRTFTAFMGTLKESLASGWSEIFTALIGNLEQSTKMWTGFSNAIGGVVGKIFHFAETAIVTWRTMGGFNKTIEGFKNLLAPIGAVLTVIGAAWRKAFPNSSSGTGKALYGLSAGFAAITKPLQWLATLIEQATNPLAFFFKTIHLGVSIVKSAGGIIGDFIEKLLGLVNFDMPSGTGMVDFIKSLAREISKAVTKIDNLLAKGKSLTEAFGSVDIKLPKMPNLPSLDSILGGVKKAEAPKIPKIDLDNFGPRIASTEKLIEVTDKAIDSTEKLGMKFNPDARITPPEIDSEGVVTSAENFEESVNRIGSAGDKMGSILTVLGEKFMGFVRGFNMDDLMASLNLAILGTVMIRLSQFLNSLTNSFGGFGDVLGGAGDALKSFQTAARAKLILNIAIALGVLAASLFLLSLIPADRMKVALLGMAGMVTALTVTMLVMTKMIEKLDGKGISVRLVALGIAVSLLAAGILLLAIAFKVMEKTDWSGILKGLITVGVVMKAMEAIGKLGKGSAGSMIAASVAIGLIAASMILLAGALLLFKLVDWSDMGKAGAALAGLTVAVAALALIPYQGIAKVGLAMLTASLGVESLARALVIFGFVKWESLAKAGVALAGLTVALAALMIVGNPVTVGGMMSMAVAMIGLAAAAVIMNNVEWASLGKIGVILGLVTLAFAGFLAVVSFFAPALILLAGFAGSIALLAIALTGLALAFAVIAPLLGAGTAMFAAFATGAAVAIAVFLQSLALQAPIMKDSMLKILQAAIDGIVEAVPMIIDGVQRLIDAVVKQFQADDKKTLIGDSGKSWVTKLMDGIRKKIPELVSGAANLMIRFIAGLASKAAMIGAKAAEFVAKFIAGIASKIGGVITAGANLVIKFIAGVAKESIRIANAAADVIINFINKMAETIRTKGPQLGDAMGNLGIAMVEGLIGGIDAMFDRAMSKIGDLASGLANKAKGVLKIFSPSRVFHNIGQFLVMGLTNGIQSNAAAAITAVASMVSGQIAVANEFVDRYIQTLDQRAIAARAKADGLALAAEKAAKEARKTKTKTDDKAAEKLAQQAQAAAQQATAAEKKADAAKVAQDRAEKWKEADSFERAQIRSEDAQRQLEAAKAAEARAAKNVAAANALDRQAQNRNLSPAERRRLEKEADRLREQARRDAQYANQQLAAAKMSAADALVWQQKAGAEAAKAFEEQFKAEAKADADAEAFEKLTNEEKAKQRREEAAKMEAIAKANLEAAKKLAYSDLEAANKLAQQAMEEAEQARQFLDQAVQFETQGTGGGGGPLGTVVNVDPTEAAAIAFNQYADLYASATAAAAATQTVEFNQYNTSPESLSPTEVYRQTNNLLTHAVDKLQPVA